MKESKEPKNPGDSGKMNLDNTTDNEMEFADFMRMDDYEYYRRNDGYVPPEFGKLLKGVQILLNTKYAFASGSINKPANGLMFMEVGIYDEKKKEFVRLGSRTKSFANKRTTSMSVEFEGGPGKYLVNVKFDAKSGPGKQVVTGSAVIELTEEDFEETAFNNKYN